jgi:hypothetical protein
LGAGLPHHPEGHKEQWLQRHSPALLESNGRNAKRNISFSNGGGAINTDLKGLNALQVMDKIISAAGALVGPSPASNQASATTQSSSDGFACHVAYKNVNQWSTGFQAAITIQNVGTVGISSWTLKWTFSGNQRIANLWNGSYLQSGSVVTVKNLSYNGGIPAGSSYSGLGFTANFSGANAAPASFSVNGVTCR